jgi:hypothetical protein
MGIQSGGICHLRYGPAAATARQPEQAKADN